MGILHAHIVSKQAKNASNLPAEARADRGQHLVVRPAAPGKSLQTETSDAMLRSELTAEITCSVLANDLVLKQQAVDEPRR